MEIVNFAHCLFDRPLVATIGFFDGVHLGHRYLLEFVKKYAQDHNMLSAIVTFSNNPSEILHPDSPAPIIMDMPTKISLFKEMNFDVCIIKNFTTGFSKITAQDFVHTIKLAYGVKALVMGYDHGFGSDRDKIDSARYTLLGRKESVRIVRGEPFFPDGMAISSSIIRRRIEGGYVTEAGRMLGRPYVLSGKVVSGNGIGGKDLGFPTANISLSSNFVIPLSGVYVVKVKVRGKIYDGMLNIGTNPTVSSSGKYSIEVNIFDFNEDIYGEEISVELVGFVRKEEKYKDKIALMHQIEQDKEQIQKMICSL
ncbi:MAG TPA: hypothetical protein DDY68_03390 [Porphyromonadaceae bacterium]|nr:hypothetical protein [Porphyromonadaceae bacterium]